MQTLPRLALIFGRLALNPSEGDVGERGPVVGLKAGALALLASILWGGNQVFIKVGLDGIPPLAMAGLRFVLGVLALALGIGLGLGFYRRTSRLMNRVDAGVDKVEAMVDSVESTASTVGKTATSMNRGMKAGGFARTAVNTVFGRNND